MKRSTTPSFVCEFEIQATSRDRHVLRSRLEAGRQLYNAVLGEALVRLARMRRDPAFERTKALPRGSNTPDATSLQKTQAKVRRDAFKALRESHGFREFDLHRHPSLAATCWLRGHLDVHAAQKVATRAFRATGKISLGDGPVVGEGEPAVTKQGAKRSAAEALYLAVRQREEETLGAGCKGELS